MFFVLVYIFCLLCFRQIIRYTLIILGLSTLHTCPTVKRTSRNSIFDFKDLNCIIFQMVKQRKPRILSLL